MLFGNKSPGLLCLNLFEQLDANAVHLRGVQQTPLFLAHLLEEDLASMQPIMAGFTQCQEIAFLIASVLAKAFCAESTGPFLKPT